MSVRRSVISLGSRSIAILALLLAGCGHVEQGGDWSLTYDMRFDSSAPGQAPEIEPIAKDLAFPRHTPTSIEGGPIGVDSLCGLADRPLRLDSRGGDDVIEMAPNQRHSVHSIGLDLCIVELGEPARSGYIPQVMFFADVPTAYYVGFTFRGDIVLGNAGAALEGEADVTIGRWEKNVPLRLEAFIDLEGGSWNVSIDGEQVYEGAIVGSRIQFYSVRVKVRGSRLNQVGVDNVLIRSREAPPAQ